MSKYLATIVLGVVLSHSALADTNIPWTKEGCESVKGTWITAHSPTDAGCDAAHCNGKNFCKSNIDVHLFSALTWCKAIGRELASLEDACPNSISTNTCANLNGKFNDCVWTTTPISGTQNYRACGWGELAPRNYSSRNDHGYYKPYALCK